MDGCTPVPGELPSIPACPGESAPERNSKAGRGVRRVGAFRQGGVNPDDRRLIADALAGHAHAVARIFLVAGLAAATFAAPAHAQKPGGTLTVTAVPATRAPA